MDIDQFLPDNDERMTDPLWAYRFSLPKIELYRNAPQRLPDNGLCYVYQGDRTQVDLLQHEINKNLVDYIRHIEVRRIVSFNPADLYLLREVQRMIPAERDFYYSHGLNTLDYHPSYGWQLKHAYARVNGRVMHLDHLLLLWAIFKRVEQIENDIKSQGLFQNEITRHMAKNSYEQFLYLLHSARLIHQHQIVDNDGGQWLIQFTTGPAPDVQQVVIDQASLSCVNFNYAMFEPFFYR